MLETQVMTLFQINVLSKFGLSSKGPKKQKWKARYVTLEIQVLSLSHRSTALYHFEQNQHDTVKIDINRESHVNTRVRFSYFLHSSFTFMSETKHQTVRYRLNILYIQHSLPYISFT